MTKTSPDSIAAIGDNLFIADLCNAFNVARGERELPNLVLAMAEQIIELSRPKSPRKKSSGGRPTKWTPEAQAALIVDVQRELAEGYGLAVALDRIANAQPWQRMTDDRDEQGDPDTLKQAYNRAKKSEKALALVEMFDGYRSSLGRDIWRARTGRIIEASHEIESKVREQLKKLVCAKCGATTTSKRR